MPRGRYPRPFSPCTGCGYWPPLESGSAGSTRFLCCFVWGPLFGSRSCPVSRRFSALPAHLLVGERRAPPDLPGRDLQLPAPSPAEQCHSRPHQCLPGSPQAVCPHPSPRLHWAGRADSSRAPRLLLEPLNCAPIGPYSSPRMPRRQGALSFPLCEVKLDPTYSSDVRPARVLRRLGSSKRAAAP
ncbi:hypothetical protein NDU88_006278 [Pleurodeles waltl]|uniref:Uncharacterized protein n=1 Tax=Pleurodeles waltl TaxID=8319 RepID=A0AAV7SPA9_PLEWA|nr:hypothetical protein NDU88_006278 [Pleurodeles waltl]